MTFGSLFSGVGGLDLGLERSGMSCRWQVEINPFCRKVLAKHWPDVPKYSDITQISGDELEHVDLIAGGFPCQDVSHAGLREGITGARSGLWSHFARLIRRVRPRLVLVENVTGLLDRGMGDVLGELAGLGFDAEWHVLPACAFGAPHPRQRVFIVAHATGERQGQLRRFERPEEGKEDGHLYWPEPEPRCERVLDGVPDRVERLTALGNAVAPPVAEWIGRRILAASSYA